jgi:ribose transport system substrate-binding protein
MSLKLCFKTFVSGIALLAGLSACGGSGSSGSDSGRPKIAFLLYTTTLAFAQEMGQGFQAGAQLAGGVDAAVTGPQVQDAPRQVEIFKGLTKSAKDGISVSATEPELLARPLAEAGKDGIPLIAVESPPAAGSGLKLYIGNDNEALGQRLADEAIKRLPPNATGKIILGTNAPGVPSLERRTEGLRSEFAKKVPNVHVMGPFDVKSEVPANKVAWQQLVAANPDALAFLGTGDMDAFNLAAVRRETKGKWLAGGFGLGQPTLQAVRDGDVFASMSPEHYVKGAIAGWLEAKHAKDDKPMPEGWIYTPGLLVTSGNVDEIVNRQSSEASKLAWFKPQLDKMTADLKPYLRPLRG